MAITIRVDFEPEFRGTMDNGRYQVALGKGEGQASPYELLLSALAGCYYDTFLDVMNKKRIAYTGAQFDLTGVKRTTIPTTLETCDMTITIKGAEAGNEKAFNQAAELAKKYCSVYQTLSHVAEINVKLVFTE